MDNEEREIESLSAAVIRSDEMIKTVGRETGQYPSMDVCIELAGITGIYYEDKGLYTRTVRIYSPTLGKPVYVNTLVQLEENTTTGQVRMTSKGILSKVTADDAILDALNAFGIVVDTETVKGKNFIEYCKDGQDEDKWVLLTLDEDNEDIWTYPKEFIASIYDKFVAYQNEQGTDSDWLYTATQKEYEPGQGTLVDWDNSKLAEVVGTLSETGQIRMDIGAQSVYEQLKSFSETDADLQAIMNCPNVRIFMKQPYGPNVVQMFVYGYTLSNNTIVTTQESGSNQHYGVTITSYKTISYWASATDTSDYPALHKQGSWSGTTSLGVTLYNHPQWGWYNTTNGTTSGGVVSGVVFDSMGYVGDVKPYELLPNATYPDRTKNLDDGYPEWPGEEWKPLDPDPDPPTQIVIWRGILPDTIVIEYPPVVPPPGVPPIDTSDGSTESTNPTGSSSYGLFTVYNPNIAAMSTLSHDLWDANILEQIERIFQNNPMDAIISLHQVYFTPKVYSDPQTHVAIQKKIRLANIDTKAHAPVIYERYGVYYLGQISIDRYYGDARDYQTKVTVYLPFVGFQEVNIADCIGGAIQIMLNADSYTGDILYSLKCYKQGSGVSPVLYTFNGNAAVTIPMTAQDRNALIRSSIAAIPAVASGVAKMAGGAATGNFLSAASGAGDLFNTGMNVMSNAQANITRNGSLSGNVGAMGCKYPYVIIERPIAYDASDYKHYYGAPANISVNVGGITGYTEFKKVHVETIGTATQMEKDNIERILMTGVIL